MKHNQLADCIKYFKGNSAYKRVFDELRHQWKKYGRNAGWIQLHDATEPEQAALRAILGRDFSNANVRFRMSEFQMALQETKYDDVEIPELIAGYFGELLVTNKKKQMVLEEQKAVFFAAIKEYLALEKIDMESLADWIDYLTVEKTAGYILVMSVYKKNKKQAQCLLENVCQAVLCLEQHKDERLRLAVLSAKITANPHYFDRGQIEGRLLLYALSYVNKTEYPKDAERVLELYFLSGIRPDDISSFTTAYGIHLYTKKGRHPAYEGFIRENEIYMVNLSGLEHIVQAIAPRGRVFIVENQMVFSVLCEKVMRKDTAMICTSGQMKTASLILIDLLCQTGCEIYYSGDFDPEGIQIADRIIKRHSEQIHPWHFTIKDYVACRSQEKLSVERLKKLDKIENPGLQKIAKEIRCYKLAGYQEMIVDKLIKDIEM